jgi:hypothetical protein
MKAILGLISLLLVLAMVGSIARKQLAAGVASAPAASAARADGEIPTVPQQARAIEDDIRERAARAVQEGAERNRAAEP